MIKCYRGLIKRIGIYENMHKILRIWLKQDIYISNKFVFPTFNRRSQELDSHSFVETGDTSIVKLTTFVRRSNTKLCVFNTGKEKTAT